VSIKIFKNFSRAIIYRNEIPKIVVSSLRLRNFIVRSWLSSVNNIREFDCVLNEKDGDVVADEIKIALWSVEFSRESTNISYGIS